MNAEHFPDTKEKWALVLNQCPFFELVPMTGIELVTYSLRVSCSTN
jgi:hypothetical protein